MSTHPIELIIKVLRAIETREWSAPQVCRAYRLSHHTVRHWIRNGLPYYEKKLEAENRLLAEAASGAVLPLGAPSAKAAPSDLTAVSAPMDAESAGHITTLSIPDLHAPFAHRDALPFLLEVYSQRKCGRVVCLGDEVDAHALGRFPKDPDGMGAGRELQAAIEQLIPFYRRFRRCMFASRTTRCVPISERLRQPSPRPSCAR